MKFFIEATKDVAAIAGCAGCALGILWIAAVATGIWK